jgi:hypothetical protein
MKKIYLGDTVNYSTTAFDSEGNPITTATANLKVIDSAGSTVLNEDISHAASGTYTETKSSEGYALGPVKQIWTVGYSGGTSSEILENSFRIVNTEESFQSYVFVSELEGYFPGVRDYLDNQSEDHVISSYKYANRLIESLGYYTPLEKNDDGFFDQSVRDFCAWDSIYRIVKADQIVRVASDSDGRYWFDGFKDSADKTYKDWSSKKVVFKSKVSAGEAGILPSRRTQGSSTGTCLTNHDETYGSGFRGSDYRRDWSVEITGTGTSGGLKECSFKWSMDGGLGTSTGTTTDGWAHLADQVYIRFHRGTSTAITGIFAVGDKWEWNTNPVRNQVGGKRTVKGY